MSGREEVGRQCGCLLAGCVVLLAVPPRRLPADTFTFSGDTITHAPRRGRPARAAHGHARVQSQDLRITADSIELFGKDFIYAQCQGNVHVVDAKRGLDLTSQELFYDRDQKIARIKGNAVMADLKNEMVVKGGFIEDRDNEQITIIQIGVRIFKKDIICRAEFARTSGTRRSSSSPACPGCPRRGDVYQAARITINLDTEEISLEGSVQGTIEDKGEEPASDTGAAAPRGRARRSGNTAAPAETRPPGSDAARGRNAFSRPARRRSPRRPLPAHASTRRRRAPARRQARGPASGR